MSHIEEHMPQKNNNLEFEAQIEQKYPKKRRPDAARAKMPANNSNVEDASLNTLKSESLDLNKSFKLDPGKHKVSAFREEECGEPLRNQHLQLDFTTKEGLDDNIYIQKKCIDFWEFVSKHHELEKLRVNPIHVNKEDVFSSELFDEDDEEIWKYPEELQNNKSVEPTAIDWLEQKGLMSQALASKELKVCEIGSGDYCPGWRSVAEYRKLDEPDSTLGIPGVSPTTLKAQTSPDDIDELMRDMDYFDLMHPRSMSSPEHPPSVIKAKLRRIRPRCIEKQA